ncbi:hypothetical protein [Flavihumibacter sp. CACIAM 22H1]|uniref:hypothetical protein n=1 Tax=Flavihumibacter sp. CACIAM 22H1 TaxID=1812911 RepID=UPI0007A7D7E5|nr:hypothetical protein [Flavihumibacter sp. CACIAM 22H1]KYP15343.1 MAG: hypothetical protein A1D16_15700 [Flavihumibacter sp. CACIAM 22H1]
MEEDTEKRPTGVIKIPLHYQEYLNSIRDEEDLLISQDHQYCWVKGLNVAALKSPKIQRIPFLSFFELKNDLLYQLNALLPDQELPQGLKWQPINEKFPIQIPAFNHNYFGLAERINIQLVKAEEEREPVAIITSYAVLKSYIETAPAIRLKGLKWISMDVLQEKYVMIIGTPILPIPGNTFCLHNSFYIPSGYIPALPILDYTIQEMLNFEEGDRLIWLDQKQVIRLNEKNFRPLSISSFRLTR